LDIIFKTSINPRIYFHWIFLIVLVSIILYHFNSNPIGLSIIILLLISTLLVNPISYISLGENEIILEKTYGFLYSKKEKISLNDLKRIHCVSLGTSVSDGGWVLTGNYEASVIIHILTGSYFYQKTYELEFYNETQQLVKGGYSVNISRNQLLKFIDEFKENKTNSTFSFLNE
jgi:CRISPR/Cas system-associated endonuclease Cas1